MKKNKEKRKITIADFFVPLIIAIIAIVLIIAIYNTVKRRNKVKAYNNLILQIESAAEKWAADNEIEYSTTITINKLVNEDYIKEITNPLNTNDNMKCETIYVEKSSNNYKAKINNVKDCSLAKEEEINLYLEAKSLGVEDTLLKSGQWTNNNILLSIKGESKVLSCTWYKNGVKIENLLTDQKSLEITTDEYLSDKYTAIIKTESSSKKFDFIVNIDKIKPKIIIDFNELTYKVTVGENNEVEEIKYCLTTKDCNPDNEYKNTEYFEVKAENEKQSICVSAKDIAGNITKTCFK